ncbi:MAG: putative metallopeptidase [Aureliella sp.]
MGTTYERAGAEYVDLLDEVMEMYHPKLREAGVSVDLLLAHGDPESDEPAVKAHGYPAAAVVRIVNLKDRVKGCADSEIVLDGDRVDEWSVTRLKAILDHELTHLELAYDKYGELKRDDLDRPKLTMRLHDRQFGWFDEVAKRWGLDSIECDQALTMVRDWEFAQLYLPGLDPNEVGTVKPEDLAESVDADKRHHESFADEVAAAFRDAGVNVVRNVSV